MVAVAPGQSADETGSEHAGAAQYSCSRTCMQYTIYDTRYTRYVWRIARDVCVYFATTNRGWSDGNGVLDDISTARFVEKTDIVLSAATVEEKKHAIKISTTCYERPVVMCMCVLYATDRLDMASGETVVIIARRNQTGERFFFFGTPKCLTCTCTSVHSIVRFPRHSVRWFFRIEIATRFVCFVFGSTRDTSSVCFLPVSSRGKKQLHRFRLRSFPHIVPLHRTRWIHCGRHKIAVLFAVYWLSVGRNKYEKCHTCVRLSSYRIQT